MKKILPLFFIPVVAFVLLIAAQADFPPSVCNNTCIGKTDVYNDTSAHTLFFIAGMNIDADGSPRAYHPDDTSGLDNLANAGKPGRWWGIATLAGKPVVQDSASPYPGFYISTTALFDPIKSKTDPGRYVNAETIPYFVLPAGLLYPRLSPGDLGYVRNLRNGKSSFAIYADVGPGNRIGEGSIRLADTLGIPSNARKGGVSDSVLYIVFPGSGIHRPLTVTEIDSTGRKYFRKEMVREYLSGK